jgi:hypothetical protein
MVRDIVRVLASQAMGTQAAVPSEVEADKALGED